MVRNLFSLMNSKTKLEDSVQEPQNAVTSDLRFIYKGGVSKLDGQILLAKVKVKKSFCSEVTPIEG